MTKAKLQRRIRRRVIGRAGRPRLAVYRSLRQVTAQLIDDDSGKTLASASSQKLTGPLTFRASGVGEAIAKAAKAKKITTIVFDRGGFAYHGAIRALAEAARKAGLKF